MSKTVRQDHGSRMWHKNSHCYSDCTSCVLPLNLRVTGLLSGSTEPAALNPGAQSTAQMPPCGNGLIQRSTQYFIETLIFLLLTGRSCASAADRKQHGDSLCRQEEPYAQEQPSEFRELPQTVRKQCDAKTRACSLKCWDLWTRFGLDRQRNLEGMLLA